MTLGSLVRLRTRVLGEYCHLKRKKQTAVHPLLSAATARLLALKTPDLWPRSLPGGLPLTASVTPPIIYPPYGLGMVYLSRTIMAFIVCWISASRKTKSRLFGWAFKTFQNFLFLLQHYLPFYLCCGRPALATVSEYILPSSTFWVTRKLPPISDEGVLPMFRDLPQKDLHGALLEPYIWK